MTTPPGADEARVRHLLAERGVSYAPQTPPPASGWWDALYDDDHDDHHHGPDQPPAAAPRLPDWRKGETADLHGPDPDPPDSNPPVLAKEPVDDEPEEPDTDDDWQDTDEPDPAQLPPTHRPRAATTARRAHTAYLELPARTRALLYTGSAAAAGYALGLVPLIHSWIAACGRDTSPTAALILGGGIVLTCGVAIDRRTRGWWGPLPWLCRIPLASALLALALYAPGATS